MLMKLNEMKIKNQLPSLLGTWDVKSVEVTIIEIDAVLLILMSIHSSVLAYVTSWSTTFFQLNLKKIKPEKKILDLVTKE